MDSISLIRSSTASTAQGRTLRLEQESVIDSLPSCHPLNKVCPERYKAIRYLFLQLEKDGPGLVPQDLGPVAKITPGFFSFYTQELRVKDLPVGDGWRWNQSRGTLEITLPGDIDLRVIKLSPRRLRSNISSTALPNYKLWRFAIKRPGASQIFACWCERAERSSDNRGAIVNASTLSSPTLYELRCDNEIPSGDSALSNKASTGLRVMEQFTTIHSDSPPLEWPEGIDGRLFGLNGSDILDRWRA